MQNVDEIFPLITKEMQKQENFKLADGGHICLKTKTKFGWAQLDDQGNIPDQFRRNLPCGLKEDCNSVKKRESRDFYDGRVAAI